MDKPLHASNHCRHYEYDRSADGGPRCACGIDNSLATTACMPPVVQKDRRFDPCPWREEFTFDEHEAWGKWRAQAMERASIIMQLIPFSLLDKEDRQHWGKTDSFKCPCCSDGTVRWVRSRVNGHVHAACSTEDCFQVMQ